MGQPRTAHPQLERYFLGTARGWGTFIGGEAKHADEFDDLLAVFNNEIMTGFPDTFGFVGRAGIFGGSRGGRRIDVDLSAESFESLLAAGRTGFYILMQEMPDAQVQPLPGLELAEPELRLIPRERRIAEAGSKGKSVEGNKYTVPGIPAGQGIGRQAFFTIAFSINPATLNENNGPRFSIRSTRMNG